MFFTTKTKASPRIIKIAAKLSLFKSKFKTLSIKPDSTIQQKKKIKSLNSPSPLGRIKIEIETNIKNIKSK
ncbi:MAG: hypothetical protein HC930_08385 [Hydrococcus sp. SU_1_0]|nr:hypothetical protein [Hydrococcus sp. SU_1_0]